MRKIIKQDINFLDKPLWFQTKDTTENGLIWRDIQGYEYRAGYKVPDKLDALFLLYFVYRAQQCDYVQQIVLSRYEILKDCDLSIDSKNYERIEDSLKRWKNVSIEFQGTFYDGLMYKTISFGVIDAYSIRKEDKRLEIRFSPEWLLMIEKSAFFKYINFEFYKALKRPVSRRLFEILCKSFHGRNSWEIDAVKLGYKLTLTPKKVESKMGQKEILYPSIVLTAIKPAINEINKNALNPDLLKEANLSPENAFTVSYTVKNSSDGSKVIQFNKIPVSKLSSKALKTHETNLEAADHKQTTDLELTNLFDLLKHKTAHLKGVIRRYYAHKGFEYVRWNILYANDNANNNYAVYLKQALEQDWAAQFKEEQQAEQERQRAEQVLESKIKTHLKSAQGAKTIIFPSGEKCPIKFVSTNAICYLRQKNEYYATGELLLACAVEF